MKPLRDLISHVTSHFVDKYKFERINLQLFGFKGHGKSTLINWCVSVAQDKAYSNVTGASIGHSTMERKSYKLMDHLYITDNRGFTDSPDEDYFLEICAQIRQVRKEGPVTWGCDIKKTLDVLIDTYSQSELLIPVFVFRKTPKYDLSKLRPLFEKIKCITGVDPIVVVLMRQESRWRLSKRLLRLDYTQLEFPAEHKRDELTDMLLWLFLTYCVCDTRGQLFVQEKEKRQSLFVKEASLQMKEESRVAAAVPETVSEEVEDPLERLVINGRFPSGLFEPYESYERRVKPFYMFGAVKPFWEFDMPRRWRKHYHRRMEEMHDDKYLWNLGDHVMKVHSTITDFQMHLRYRGQLLPPLPVERMEEMYKTKIKNIIDHDLHVDVYNPNSYKHH